MNERVSSRTQPGSAATDESWPIIEEAVFRLFDEITGKHTPIGPRLIELGWSDIESEYPVEACELLFRAQGRSLAHTDCLDRALLAELGPVLDGPADAVVIPAVAQGYTPGSAAGQVSGLVLGQLEGRIAVPVSGPVGKVSIGVVDAATLHGQRLNTFDPSVEWTLVSGTLHADLVEASREWDGAVAAAHRSLATELVTLTDRMLHIATEHATARSQFGAAIGSFQSPRHALAEACAALDGARALLGEAWRYGEPLCAHAAKAAAGRAHRTVADTALQICGAIGLTAEHDLHRYLRRGFQLDALFGDHQQLESLLAEQLFNTHTPGRALPPIVVCG